MKVFIPVGLALGHGAEDRFDVNVERAPDIHQQAKPVGDCAVFGTDLEFVLRGLGIRRMIVAGTSTNWAIEATVRDAESLDYEVIVARDATGARMGDLHEPALRSIASRYGEVRSVDEIVAGTP